VLAGVQKSPARKWENPKFDRQTPEPNRIPTSSLQPFRERPMGHSSCVGRRPAKTRQKAEFPTREPNWAARRAGGVRPVPQWQGMPSSVEPEGRAQRNPSLLFPYNLSAISRKACSRRVEPEGRNRLNPKVGHKEIHPYFCPTFASRAANWSCLPSRGAAKKAQVELVFRPTRADANRPQRSLGDDS
jgi:hypothetical protein